MRLTLYLLIPLLAILFLFPINCQAKEILVNTSKIVFLEFNKETAHKDSDEYTAKFIENNKVIAKMEYVDGQISEKYGKIPDGLAVVLFKTGQVRSLISYKNQNRHGIATSYFKNGTLEHIVYYDNGFPTGESIIYYPNGKVHVEAKYKDGKELYLRQYGPNGKLEFERGQPQ